MDASARSRTACRAGPASSSTGAARRATTGTAGTPVTALTEGSGAQEHRAKSGEQAFYTNDLLHLLLFSPLEWCVLMKQDVQIFRAISEAGNELTKEIAQTKEGLEFRDIIW